MLSNVEIIKRISDISEKDKRYHKEAYLFVLVALEYTLSMEKKRRHLSGQELSKGIADYARYQYGYMAKIVLESWDLKTTLDFGEIVYLMIEQGLMSKTQDDRKEDFSGVYGFNEEFAWRNLPLSEFPERF